MSHPEEKRDEENGGPDAIHPGSGVILPGPIAAIGEFVFTVYVADVVYALFKPEANFHVVAQ